MTVEPPADEPRQAWFDRTPSRAAAPELLPIPQILDQLAQHVGQLRDAVASCCQPAPVRQAGSGAGSIRVSSRRHIGLDLGFGDARRSKIEDVVEALTGELLERA